MKKIMIVVLTYYGELLLQGKDIPIVSKLRKVGKNTSGRRGLACFICVCCLLTKMVMQKLFLRDTKWGDYLQMILFCITEYCAGQWQGGSLISIDLAVSVSSGDELSISSFSLSRPLIAGDFPSGHITNYRWSFPFFDVKPHIFGCDSVSY